MDQPLPSYDQLPVSPGAPPGSSWGLWGADDVLGASTCSPPSGPWPGRGLVQSGRVFNLNLELELPEPPLYGRPAFEHVVVDRRSGHDDLLSSFNTQSSSQWDGFRHIRHQAYGFYNGVADEDHGVHHWVRHGLVGRAVLADVARRRHAEGRPLVVDRSDPITADDLASTLAAQGSELEVGDVLLVRTGWMAWYRSLGPADRAELASSDISATGLAAGRAMAAFLWDHHVAAVAADNPALECLATAPGRPGQAGPTGGRGPPERGGRDVPPRRPAAAARGAHRRALRPRRPGAGLRRRRPLRGPVHLGPAQPGRRGGQPAERPGREVRVPLRR